MKVNTDQAAGLKQIARMAYGWGRGEGASGGRGNIGLLGDGTVVKFNTHWSERHGFSARVTDQMVESSQALRSQLAELARQELQGGGKDVNTEGGDGQATLRSVLKLLGVAEDNGTYVATTKELLTRKVVARVLAKIQKCKKTDYFEGVGAMRDTLSTADRKTSLGFALQAAIRKIGTPGARGEEVDDKLLDQMLDRRFLSDSDVRRTLFARGADYALTKGHGRGARDGLGLTLGEMRRAMLSGDGALRGLAKDFLRARLLQFGSKRRAEILEAFRQAEGGNLYSLKDNGWWMGCARLLSDVLDGPVLKATGAKSLEDMDDGELDSLDGYSLAGVQRPVPVVGSAPAGESVPRPAVNADRGGGVSVELEEKANRAT